MEMKENETIAMDRVSVRFTSQGRVVPALDDITTTFRLSELVSVVGESGAGKTTLGRALLGLAKPDSGAVMFRGRNIHRLGKREMKDFRKHVQVVFQDPYDVMNPKHVVLDYLSMPLRFISGVSSRADLRSSCSGLLDQVGLEREFLSKYPHQLSGGQKQRIAIARALATEPDFIVADEPTSMLDASAAAGILNLLRKLAAKRGMGYMIITHNMGVAAYASDRIVVMYSGKVVEDSAADDIVNAPRHPYTSVLISHAPLSQRSERKLLAERDGSDADPDATDPWKLSGCRYFARCPRGTEECRKVFPALSTVPGGGSVACWNPLVNDDGSRVS